MAFTIPNFQEKENQQLNKYIKNENYQNFIRLMGGENATVANIYNQIKGEASQLQNAGDKDPKLKDIVKYAYIFALKRDYTNRYASRMRLMASAIDKKFYFNESVKGKMQAIQN